MMALAKTDTNDAKIRVTLIGDQQAVKGVNKKWFTGEWNFCESQIHRH